MNLRVREAKNINILDVEGRIDINSSVIIETVGWLLKNGKKDILLNFDKVELIDYSGLSILAIAYKNVLNHKGKMKFCNVSLHLEELFNLVRLDSVFEIYGNEKTALKSFHFESPMDKKLLRRRFKRLYVHIEAEFHRTSRESGKEKINWRTGKILNLSGEGLFLYAKNVIGAGKEIELKIKFNKNKLAEVKGVVIWLADKSLQPQSYPGMGIHFKKIRKIDQDRILEFINKHITSRSTSV